MANALGSYLIKLPIIKGTNLVGKTVLAYVQKYSTVCDSTDALPSQLTNTPRPTVVFNGFVFNWLTGRRTDPDYSTDWVAYSTRRSEICVNIVFELSSKNSSGPDGLPPYDRAAESAVFDQIMATFTWPTP